MYQHLVSVEQLSAKQVMALIHLATQFKHNQAQVNLKRPVYVANLFFENSTRTHMSFAMAERKLGLTELPFDVNSSSVKKGETLYDTALTLDAIGVDLLVIRNSQNEYYRDLIDLQPHQTLDVGILNAGDGSGQHPSQSLLDMMTIFEEFGHFEGLKVVICGDLRNSRVARSNVQLLTKLGATVYLAGPKQWYDERFERFGKFVTLDEVIDQVDVVMLLRVQHERHNASEETAFDAASYHRKFGLNQERYAKMQPHAIIMHPGPINRGVELADELVEAKQSRFKQQMKNGVFMRMAMLTKVMQHRNIPLDLVVKQALTPEDEGE